MKKVPLSIICFLVTALVCFSSFSTPVAAEDWTKTDDTMLASIYGSDERFHYEIRWLGIKAGDLIMEIKRLKPEKNRFAINITARSAGLLDLLYPIEDTFESIVEGAQFFPLFHSMQQKEGRRRNYKETHYDQKKFVVKYKKNDREPVRYKLSGPVHNEFTSFFVLRILPLKKKEQIIVPTFADKKRHMVQVLVHPAEERASIFGTVNALKVIPHLTFKGLYTKMNDPVIWLSDDSLRIPLAFKAKIKIGSLTATLIDYWRKDGRTIAGDLL